MNSNEETSLYIGNLDYDISKEDLNNLFGRFGNIEELKLIPQKGIAFITLEKAEDAELAMKALNGINFLDRKLIIDWARHQKRKNETV